MIWTSIFICISAGLYFIVSSCTYREKIHRVSYNVYSQMFPSDASKIYFPETTKDVQEIVGKYASRTNVNDPVIKVIAGLHSMSAMTQTKTQDVVLSLDRMNKIVSVDREHDLVRVQAGIRLKDLSVELERLGYSMENLGQIMFQSIAGAIATSTHGTGKGFGSISTQVRHVQLVDGKGLVHEIGEGHEYFDAVRCHLGVLGVVTEVTLKVEKFFHLELHEYGLPLDETRKNWKGLMDTHDYFRFWYIPYTNYTKIITLDRTAEPAQDYQINNFIKAKIEVPGMSSLMYLCALFPQLTSPLLNIMKKLIAKPVDRVGKSYEMLTGPVPDAYTEMEYFFPLENFWEAFDVFDDYLHNNPHGFRMNFVNENRNTDKDDIWLSPFYGRDSASISFIAYHQNDLFKTVAAELDLLFEKLGGRPHWGKWSQINNSQAKKLYPKFEEFQRVRQTLDPKNLFLNDWAKGIF